MGRVLVLLLSTFFLTSCAPQDLSYAVNRIYNFVLGQKSISYNEDVISFSSRQMITVGSKFITTDIYGSRVLIWNDKSNATNGTPADVIIGQPGMNEVFSNNGGVSAKSLYYPYGIATDGTRLFISDMYNHRILIYNSIPSTNFASADLVLGQPDFISNTENNGGASASSLSYPASLFYTSGKLLVVDNGNSRVLIWTNPVASNNQAADLVIGQPNFTTVSTGVTNSKMRWPHGIWTDGTKVLVADSNNHRVLVWDTFPVANGQAANWVLGQTLFTTRTANLGGLSASTLYEPRGLYSDGTVIAVTDMFNNRVLIWNAWPVANKPSANYVLGQADFISNGDSYYAPTQSSINQPRNVVLTTDEIIVSDVGGNRILFFDRLALANNMSADRVLGQLDFTSLDFNLRLNGNDSSLMSYPAGIANYKNKLIVSDCNKNRVMIWNKMPKDNYEPANVFIGQPDSSTALANNGGVSDKSLSCPWQVAVSASGRLFVADSNNHRILIYNSIPTTNFASADLVLGQPDFTSNSPNAGGAVSASSLNYSYYLNIGGEKLIVPDYSNSRVLIWNTLPTSNNQAADLVLGQANFTTSNYGTTSSALSYPGGSWSDGTKLIVNDASNYRILIWNTFPTVNNQAADVVVNQANFTSSAYGVSNLLINYSDSLWSDGTKLFLADSQNNRILIWNQIPTSNNTPADSVYGQSDFTSAVQGVGASNFKYPIGMTKINYHYYILDASNARVLAIHENLLSQ